MMMVTPRIIIQEEEEPAIRVGEDVDGDNFESFDPNRLGTVFSADADFDSLTGPDTLQQSNQKPGILSVARER